MEAIDIRYEFYEYAQKHHIELFRLPPHSTHLTQPLDVSCFQPFKHYHAEAIDNAMRSGEGDFGRLELLAKISGYAHSNLQKIYYTVSIQEDGTYSL